MKGVVVTTDKTVDILDFEEPLYKSVGAAVGGDIEIVRPRGLRSPFCMIVNDEGLIAGLPMNLLGSFLYGTQIHGSPIAGNIVLMKEGFRNGEPDVVGLSDDEIEKFVQLAARFGCRKSEGGS